MITKRIRISLSAAVTAAAVSSGAFLAFPAHASLSRICTSPTGTAVCVGVDSGGGDPLLVEVIEGTQPNFPNVTGVGVVCAPAPQGGIGVVLAHGGAENTAVVPINGLPC